MEAQLFQAVLQRQYMGTALVGGAINLFYGTIDKQPVTTAKTPCLGLVSLKRFFTWKLYVLFPTVSVMLVKTHFLQYHLYPYMC